MVKRARQHNGGTPEVGTIVQICVSEGEFATFKLDRGKLDAHLLTCMVVKVRVHITMINVVLPGIVVIVVHSPMALHPDIHTWLLRTQVTDKGKYRIAVRGGVLKTRYGEESLTILSSQCFNPKQFGQKV